MKIVHVASEVAPWAQTGGLGQVVGGLPLAQAESGAAVAVVAPLHRGVRERAAAAGAPLIDRGVELTAELAGATIRGRLFETTSGAARFGFVDCPALYDRAALYGEGGADYADNAVRFGFLAHAAIAAAPHLTSGAPDIVHCHDWQSGAVPLILARAAARPRIVFTIHNLAFQGLFDWRATDALDLDPADHDAFEFWGQLSLLKAGCARADAVTTVSPSYAVEVTRPEFGCGLDEFLRARGGVVGILNGIDTAMWDPTTDAALPMTYAVDDWRAGKAAARAALDAELGLDPGGILLGVVSRLTEQKGVDLVLALGDALAALDARLVLLGSGDAQLEDRLRALALAHPTRVAARIGFDEGLARRIFAGADALVMPSRFEPCGLTQMQAMRYGTLPIVNPVGGLADTVSDAEHAPAGNGFRMASVDAAGLRHAVERAVRVHREGATWSRAVDRAMTHDWSWTHPAQHYLALYRQLL